MNLCDRQWQLNTIYYEKYTLECYFTFEDL